MDELVTAAHSGDAETRHGVRRETLSRELWEELLAGPEESRLLGLWMKKVPPFFLAACARDPASRVRHDAANKRALGEEEFALLARDSDSSVRSRIAWNPKAPAAIVRQLLTDAEPFVRAEAREVLERRGLSY